MGVILQIPGQITLDEVITQEVTIASLLSDATTVLTTAVGSVWTIITGNILLTFYVGAAILAVGFAFFRKAKRTAR